MRIALYAGIYGNLQNGLVDIASHVLFKRELKDKYLLQNLTV